MSRDQRQPTVPLPREWKRAVKSAVLHVIALAQYATTYTRSWAACSANARVRLKAENDRLRQEVALLREEMRIKDARMNRIAPHRRPHYPPTERMAILELRAARGWSLRQTARAFLVAADTVAAWARRVDDGGPEALLQLPTPVNRFPDFVRYLVVRLKTLCPSMGNAKIAETLCRAGLHLGTSTVGRVLSERPKPRPAAEPVADTTNDRVVTAKRPNHVWHVDLTTVPTGGFWTSWFPLALPQCWPFCWWVGVVEDHFSRRAVGVAAFKRPPSSEQVRVFLGRAIRSAGTAPRHLICDKGPQFWCKGFKRWCRRRNIKPRFGAVGRHGSIAVAERLILTLKQTLRRMFLVPYRYGNFRREILAAIDWYNEHRPHASLDGCTPNEVYYRRRPANRRPRFEPRPDWPRGSPCAAPQAFIKGQPGARIELVVDCHAGKKHLPVVMLRRAA